MAGPVALPGGVLKTGESFADVPRHGEVDFLSGIVPFDETDRAGFVRPQAWCGFALVVAVLLKALFEKLLGNDPGLW